MIIIIGSSISEDKLPTLSEFKIIEGAAEAKMTLRLTNNPTAVFVHESLAKDLNTPLVSKAIRDNFVYFSNDNDLLKKISGISDEDNSNNEAKQDTVKETPAKPVEVPKKQDKPTVIVPPAPTPAPATAVVSEPAKPVPADVKKETGVKPGVTSQENKPAVTNVSTPEAKPVVSTSIDDGITEIDETDDDVFSNTFKIPMSINGSYDAMAAKLKAKEEQLSQFQQMFTSKCEEYDTMIREQDESTAQIIKTYENKLKEASTAFNKLKNDYSKVTSTTGKYHVYAEKTKGVLKEGFAPAEKEAIQSLGLDLCIMCTAGDVTDMHFMMQQNIETFKEDYVFIDFTGTHFFDTMYQTNLSGALRLFNFVSQDELTSLKNSFYHKEKADIIAEYNFHDITFLDSDWVTFFKNLKIMFPDRKIILLFNSISSFSVLYTLSKLATIFKAYVHLRCSYFSIQNTYTRLRLVPASRGIKLVATYYFDDVKDIITEVGKKYEIKTSTDILSLSTIENRLNK